MFVVIGERINTTLKKVKEAVKQRDVEYIQKDVKKKPNVVQLILM